jgi:DHA3 family macrolide efflux protein-like MFS transporter
MATLINMLFNPAFSLMPLLVTRVYHGDAMQFGLMNSFFGVGVILGGLALGAWGGFKRKIWTSMTGLIGMALGTLIIASAPAAHYFVLLIGMGVVGLMNPITNGPLFAFLQARIAPEMQGRVFTLVGSLAAAASPIGLALAAPVADQLGIRFWFYIAGFACLAMGISGFLIPAVRRLEDDNGVAAEPRGAPVPAAVSAQD